MAVKTFTTGEVLTAADTNTYLNNGGLVYIKSQTIGTSVTSITVSNAFSSTYDNYRITINGGVAANPTGIAIKLGASATGYYQILNYGTYATGALTTLAVNNGVSWSYCGEASTNSIALNVDLLGPNTAKYTHVMGFYPGTVGGWQSGYHGVATAYTEFTLVAGQALTGGEIRVYGYRQA